MPPFDDEPGVRQRHRELSLDTHCSGLRDALKM